eukprot:CAMPEP_0185183084 /NCGR_PEP_ID=MMETSP1140-20130426/1748_1 /TAXON_ID=298111 /ORGANISM="Pavlova sp., Strain CCMP459" /LENGTH=143 /DNA_ID=CAMNT_0027749069 /DNA_START=21 /DNA_END=453 /DNA_ORIENTATION=+
MASLSQGRRVRLALLIVAFPACARAQWDEIEPGCTIVQDCAPCGAEQKDEWYCVPTGFAQTLTCSQGAANTTKFATCISPGDSVGSFVAFEIFMLGLFGIAITVTNRRKARLVSSNTNGYRSISTHDAAHVIATTTSCISGDA